MASRDARACLRRRPRPGCSCGGPSSDGEYSRCDMDWLGVVAVSGWLLAAAALVTARRTSRRLTQLTEQYWELKYQHGEVKERVKALAPTPEEIAAAQPAVQQTFVPLSSIKR